jgi:chromosome segregation ATPase
MDFSNTMKGFKMKKVCAVAVLSSVLFLMGCGNSKLDKCRQEKESLQSNVSLLQQEALAAKEAVAKKDKTIEDLRSENTQMQTQAMESIKTMMEKQAAKDKEVKDKLTAAQQQIADLQKQLDQAKTERDQAVQQLKTPAAPAAQPAVTQ